MLICLQQKVLTWYEHKNKQNESFCSVYACFVCVLTTVWLVMRVLLLVSRWKPGLTRHLELSLSLLIHFKHISVVMSAVDILYWPVEELNTSSVFIRVLHWHNLCHNKTVTQVVWHSANVGTSYVTFSFQVFKKKIQEFREACYALTGFKIDVIRDNQYRLQSMYAERSTDDLLFEVSSTTTWLSVHLQSTACDYWLWCGRRARARFSKSCC